MKVVILAGGFGTRISEESHLKPKPMIEIGEKPIIWHIMKIYEHYGYNDFIICLGYKGYIIKEFFINYFYHNSDVTIDLNSNKIEVHKSNKDSFKVTLVDTGINTKTAGRIKRIKEYISPGESFMLTYGDGVADIKINDLVQFHKSHNKIATVTSVQPAGRFGSLDIDNNMKVTKFIEKPIGDGYWINAGFFVLNYRVFDYLNGNLDNEMWEDSPLENLAKDDQLFCFKHNGFWKCMDALRDKQELEQIWVSKKAKWKVW